MTTSREAFEAWRDRTLPTAGAVIHEIAFAAWQACEAHWREELQSEEMVELVEQYGYEAALAAISKEMGV